MKHWKIIIEDLAQLDLHEAYKWYEKEKTGLGEELFDFFEECILRIEKIPFTLQRMITPAEAQR